MNRSCRSRSHRIYPFFQNGRFFNYQGERYETFFQSAVGLLQSLYYKVKGLRCLPDSWAHGYIEVFPANLHALYTSSQPRITWVGHSTFLIQISGLNIITDPLLGDPSFLFSRMVKPLLTAEQLPLIDVVLISHNHPDHMNTTSLYALANKNSKMKILVPLGDKAWFERHGFEHVEEYTWWEQRVIEKGNHEIIFSFLPARHWSGRGMFDRNKALWGSWMIQSPEHNLYFAGDTAYSSHFAAITTEFGRVDTAILPIGPCEPQEDMLATHMNAEQAGQALFDLGAKRLIPCHWGTLWFGADYPLAPVERLRTWWQENKIALKTAELHLMKFGQTIVCDTVSAVKHITPHQREELQT